jgi:hypothetical protein
MNLMHKARAVVRWRFCDRVFASLIGVAWSRRLAAEAVRVDF